MDHTAEGLRQVHGRSEIAGTSGRADWHQDDLEGVFSGWVRHVPFLAGDGRLHDD